MCITCKALRYGGSVLIVLSTCLLLACGPDASDVELVETAKSYLKKNQVREAVLELKNALQSNAGNAEARYLLGKLQLSVGDLASAEKEFRRSADLGWIDEVVKIDLVRVLILQRKFKEVTEEMNAGSNWSLAANADLLGLLAVAKAGMGDLEQARSLLVKAENYKVDALHVLKTKAQLQLLDGETAAAFDTLTKAIKLYPRSRELLLLAARVAVVRKDVASARRFYEEVIAVEPEKLITRNGRQALIGVAGLNILDKKYAQAHEALDPVVALNSSDLEAIYLAAVLAFEEKEFDKAEIHLRNILKLVPNHEQTMLLTGTVYYAKEEFEQAAYYLGKYVSVRPEDLRARKLLGRAFIALERNDEAATTLRSALEEGSDDVELLALVGLSSLRSGQSQVGILELEKAVSLSPKSSVLRGELARAYMSKGDTELAISELERIIDGGEGAYRAQVMVVFAYLQDKKYEKARESVQKMLDQYPDDASIMNLMGIVQHGSGDLSLARQYFEKTMETDPKHTGAAINLARLDEKSGDLDGAIKRYQSIIDVEPANKTALMSLSRLALAQSDKAVQMQWLEKVRASDKADVASRVVLIEYYIQNKKLVEAELLIKELEAEHAGKPVLLVVRAELLITRESYNQAATVINELVANNPDAAIGHYLNGLNQVKMGLMDSAKISLLKAYELEPNNLLNTILLAQVRLGDGEFEQALILGEHVKKTAPARTSGFEIKGDANAGLQKYHQALQEYDAAWQIEQSKRLVLKRFQVTRKISSNKQSYAVMNDWLASHVDDYLLRFKLAESYQVDGLFDEAIAEYKRVLDAQPDNVFVLNNLAWLLNNRGDSQALIYAEKAFKLNQSAAIKDTYGWVLLKNKNTKQALILLSEAAEELSHIPDVKYHYAMALYETGDKQAAYTRLEALLASNSDFEGRADARLLLKNKD